MLSSDGALGNDLRRNAKKLAPFLCKRVTGGDFRQGKHYSRIGHYCIRPAFLGCFPEQIEIILSHLNVDLYGSFHALLYLTVWFEGQRY
jgi:hypothetical protein